MTPIYYLTVSVSQMSSMVWSDTLFKVSPGLNQGISHDSGSHTALEVLFQDHCWLEEVSPLQLKK